MQYVATPRMLRPTRRTIFPTPHILCRRYRLTVSLPRTLCPSWCMPFPMSRIIRPRWQMSYRMSRIIRPRWHSFYQMSRILFRYCQRLIPTSPAPFLSLTEQVLDKIVGKDCYYAFFSLSLQRNYVQKRKTKIRTKQR